MREFQVWRSGWTAHQRSPEALRAALADTPGDAAKWRQLGVLLLQQDASASASAFRQAVERNPFDADALVGLGLIAESRGDTTQAEKFYVRATESSRRFKPRYALASFYARAGRTSEFRRAAAAAASIDKADIGRLVRLARGAGTDPDTIPALLDLRTDYALVEYLRIAVAEKRIRPVTDVAMRLPATPEHRADLLQACDLLIEAGAAGAAVSVWNRLGILQKLEPASGQSLTNPTFAWESARGFNWRQHTVPGVEIRRAARALRIGLSGDQPENALLLEQIAPILSERSYRFSVEAELSELDPAAGLGWGAQCVPSGEALPSAPLAASSANVDLEFATNGDCRLVRLMLRYDRQPGTVRSAGTLDLISARLELLP